MSLAALIALLATVLGPSPAALAVPPDAPTGLTATQPDSTTTILSWEHVPNATRYAVTVDGMSAVSTVNNSYVPTGALPEGALNWSVTAYTGAEAGPTASGTFSNERLAAPVLTAPSSGAVLVQPNNPPLLSWAPSSGATSYKVEVDGDPDFVGGTSYTTENTSFVIPLSLGDGDWYWRVTASKGVNFNSPVSEERRFVVSPLAAPTITSPPDDATQTLQDVVLDWAPVPGAASYDVQVSKEADFSQGTALTDSATGILGTRYSPLEETYDNASYFWRVRAVDMAGQATPWTAARFSFTRSWPHRPTAVFPAAEGAEDVPAPLYFQWTPVRHASEYEIQLGTQANFTVGTFDSCRTAGTTYTPGMFAINTTGQLAPPRFNEDCKPQAAGQVYYWRVRGLDRPFNKSGDIPGVQGLFSETQSFRYMPLSVTNLSPSGGELVDVPTLTWDTATGAEHYDIRILRNNGTQVIAKQTSATSYTLHGDDQLKPEDGPFTWEITARGADGASSVTYQRVFNVSGEIPASGTGEDPLTPLTPTSSTPNIMTAPSLTWEPLEGAHHYRVDIGHAADTNQVWFGHSATDGDLFGQSVAYPAMTDTSPRLLLPGTYDWEVTAYDKDNNPIGWGPEGRFTVQPIRSATGHALAQGGQQLDANHTGAKNPCTPTTGDCEVPSTPVLKWDLDPRASYYMVYVATDPSFTNLLEPSNALPATTNSMYAPALDNRAHTYADNQAGQSFYWHIRPCRTALNCGPDPVSQTDMAQGTFQKRSPQVKGLTSTTPAGNEITFSWTDYWATNQEQPWAQTGELPNQSAKQYRVEVDDDASFAGTLIDRQLVDQATYTAPKELYPEGTLYWRVQAVDSDDNGLAWSEVQTFAKQSPQVSLTSPINDSTVGGTTPFRWSPQAFAKSYDVEVYKNNDTTFSSGNKVTSASVSGLRNTAFAPLETLPVSAEYYVWRVRRTDSFGLKGPWSVTGRFRVAAGVVTLLSPASGGSTSPNGAVLQWEKVTGAATYTVAMTSPTGALTTTTTSATAFAPTANLATGNHQWTITARDASGNPIASASSSYTVDAQLQATQRPGIQTPEGTGIGKTLTLTPPAWSPGGVAVTTSYQWLRDGSNITGATATSYTLVTADFGKSISVRATGTAPGYLKGTSTSLPVSPTSGDAIANVTPPTITGSPAAVGNRLTGNRGTWPSSYGTLTYTYAWLRDGVPIAGATSTTYTPVDADLGTELIFRVTAAATGYTSGVAHSGPVVIETLAASAPPQVSAPSGTGVGASLVGTPPVWNQSDVTSTYQWLRNGSAITGATLSTYSLTVADFGKEISWRVTGRKSGFQDHVVTSNVVAVTAGGALQATVQPTITGTAVSGETLRVSSGTWSQPTPTFKYQWLRTGAPIPGATGTSYRLTPEDAGKNISVTVLASKPGFADGSAATAAVAVPKLVSKTTATLSATRIKPGARAKLGIVVAVPGVTGPAGVIKVMDGTKVIKTLTMFSVNNGKVTVKLRKLKRGKHRIRAKYLGDARTQPSRSAGLRLSVLP